jgi:P-type Cu+ transporter
VRIHRHTLTHPDHREVAKHTDSRAPIVVRACVVVAMPRRFHETNDRDQDDDDDDEARLMTAPTSTTTPTPQRREIHTTGGASSTSTREVKLAIEGMTCGACTSGVERALRDAAGVTSASVSLVPEGVALVTFDPQRTGPRDLIDAIEDIGFGAAIHRSVSGEGETGARARSAPKREAEQYREELKLSVALTAPIVLINLIVVRIWNPKVMNDLSFWVLVKLALATRVQFGVGMRFHRGAYMALKRGASNMDVLISLGTNVAYTVSVFSILHCIFFGSMFAKDYFDTSSMLITFILIGKYLETTARGKTSEAITKLLDLTPHHALMLTPINGQPDEYTEKTIATELIHIGDLLKVLPGARVPADGVVVKGEAHVDESMVTGETMPVTRKVNARVMGGTINEGSSFIMRADKIGGDSTLYQIVQLVENAQLVKAPIQAFADRVSSIFVPVVIVLATVTFLSWVIAGLTNSIPDAWVPANESKGLFAMMFGISVLVTACPCALGLATPTAIMVGTSVAATNGILIKGADALERAGNLDVVVFDKTGTLTTGSPTVVAFKSTQPALLERVISLTVLVEKESEHPIAKAVRDYARRQSPAEIPASSRGEVENIPGQGVRCVVNGTVIALGNARLMTALAVASKSTVISEFQTLHEDKGNTVIFVSIDGIIEGAFAVSDELKPDAATAVAALKERGIESIMVTGDNWKTARSVAAACGITRVHAEASPEEKAKIIKDLQSQASPRSVNTFIQTVVAMIGDGINDAPSLASADVAMAIGAGTDIAIEAADFVLMHADLYTVVNAVDISRKTFRQIRQNYIWALGYNSVTIPLAAGVFYPSIQVPPWLASILMAFSSISVVLASLSLTKKCSSANLGRGVGHGSTHASMTRVKVIHN